MQKNMVHSRSDAAVKMPRGTGYGAQRDKRLAVNPYTVQYRYRLRWDNMLIALVAVVICFIAVPFILKGNPSSQARPTQVTDMRNKIPSDPSITLEQAITIVDGARKKLRLGQFEQASAMLARIPESLLVDSGAEALGDDIARLSAKYNQLSNEAFDYADKEMWDRVASNLAEIKRIAPLNDELRALQLRLDAAMKPQEAYKLAQNLMNAGELARALATAQYAYNKTHDAQLAQLIAQIKFRMRSPKSASGGGNGDVPDYSPTGGGTSGGNSTVNKGGNTTNITNNYYGPKGGSGGGSGTVGLSPEAKQLIDMYSKQLGTMKELDANN